MSGRRELVLASAGAGKTFRISTRIIALLDAGVPPREILASTFTRKAAGEILERVLERLADAALSAEGAGELARHVAGEALEREGPPAAGEEEADGGSARWLALLRALAREIHRTNVGTLDAFFVRAARSFTPELGLPPTWGVADRPTAERLASEALQDVLGDADPGQVVEMVRMLLRGDTARSVHGRLLEQVSELREIGRQIDPRAADPWRPFADGGAGSEGPTADVEDLVRALEAADLPSTQSGEPDGRFARALGRGAEQLRAGDWEGFCAGGLAAKVLDGSLAYHGKDFPPALAEALHRCVEEARAVLVERFHRQSTAMGRLARDFDGALGRRQREEGAYGFHDLTHLLGANREDGGPTGAAITAHADLWYRLDGRVRHLLLDEFQDTSFAQWEALRPLADGLLRPEPEGTDDATVLVVADPKQSIYGWRGARPDLVHRVGRRYAMDEASLELSWRSSAEVLELVNEVFEPLAASEVWAASGDEERERADRAVAAEWLRDFRRHVPAPPMRGVPGHVRLEAGPREENPRRTARPAMMAHAAARIAELERRIPGASIGVLVRHNEAVSRLILELRDRGVDASERSGTRLTDTAAVAGVLALLRMADHPADTIQRYHAARTPIGASVGFVDHGDDEAAHRTAASVRRRLLTEGYGRTLSGWARALCEARAVDRRDVGRLLQLVELGYRWDERPTLRPGDFVRYVESERMEDPRASRIRVMTVHQAKGLEFDVVVLPELDFLLTGGSGGGSAALPERDPETGRVHRVFPYVSRKLRPLLGEVEEAAGQARAAELRDSMGLLYVGLTRARHALHLLVPADDAERGPSSRCDPAWILRHALGARDAVRTGEVLMERGDPGWHRDPAVKLEHAGETAEEPGARAADDGEAGPERGAAAGVPLRISGRRSRILPHRSPSSLEGGGAVDLARTLHLGGVAERARGTLAHAWLEEVGWIEEGPPPETRLREIARREAPSLSREEVEGLLGRFRAWLESGPIREVLSRAAYPQGATIEAEVAFAHRIDGSLVRGQIDRLVIWEEGGAPAAEIVDFKTDAPGAGDAGALEERVAHYRSQIDAYRAAVSAGRGIPRERVGARLVFLEADRVERP